MSKNHKRRWEIVNLAPNWQRSIRAKKALTIYYTKAEHTRNNNEYTTQPILTRPSLDAFRPYGAQQRST